MKSAIEGDDLNAGWRETRIRYTARLLRQVIVHSVFPRSFLSPRYWPTWLFIGLLRLLALLPRDAGWRVGAMIGALAYRLLRRRRSVAQVNLAICFRDLSAAERDALVRATFRSTGIAFMEIAWAWWAPSTPMPIRFIGEEHLRAALAQGRGVLLLGGHYTPLELSGRHFSQINPVAALYRPHNNALLDWMIVRQRARFCTPIDRQDLRAVRRQLKSNGVVWLAPDQDFGYRNTEFVPFFGQTAATLTMPTRLAQLNDSVVLFLRHHRETDGYVLEMTPIPDFGAATLSEDAELYNRMLEQAIRQHPEQYLWLHQRFKTQPDGRRKLYRASGGE